MMIGSEGEKAIDISKFHKETGYITYDDGFGNTGSSQSSQSKITFIDGDFGILRYRGYPIEQLSERSNFIESALLVLNGELPTPMQRAEFTALLTKHAPLRQDMLRFLKSFPTGAQPMAILSATMDATGAYYPNLARNNH